MSNTVTATGTTTHTSTDLGRHLGPWRVLSRLGSGAFGQTFHVRHVHTGQEGALKELQVAPLSDWKAFDLFKREVATLGRLNHPAIPKLLDVSQSLDEAPWLVMELRRGRPLSEGLSSQSPLGQEALLRVARQALEALIYLHGQPVPVLHRDIKPSNLLMDEAGQLSLLDFGSVRHAVALDGGSTVAGTLGYIAPEQLHGESTPQSDLYSLGVTLAALASGKEGHLFPRKGLELDLFKGLPDLRYFHVLHGLTQATPSQRFSSAQQALDCLLALERGETLASKGGPSPAPKLMDVPPKTQVAPSKPPPLQPRGSQHPIARRVEMLFAPERELTPEQRIARKVMRVMFMVFCFILACIAVSKLIGFGS